jgi:hypothetical protein
MMDGMDQSDLKRMEAFNNYWWCPDNQGRRTQHREKGLIHVADNADGHKPICVAVADIANDISPEALKELLP